MIMLWVLISISLCLNAVQQNTGLKFNSFLVVRNAADGKPLCSVDQPAASSAVRSQVECAGRCAAETSCASFNYKWQTDVERPVSTCERFVFNGSSCNFTTSASNCAHYVVSLSLICREGFECSAAFRMNEATKLDELNERIVNSCSECFIPSAIC